MFGWGHFRRDNGSLPFHYLEILGKILENLQQQENLGIGQIFSSEAEQILEILGIWEILKSWNLGQNLEIFESE
jgi:hypothetical protein